jgi:hypothetical protein
MVHRKNVSKINFARASDEHVRHMGRRPVSSAAAPRRGPLQFPRYYGDLRDVVLVALRFKGWVVP